MNCFYHLNFKYITVIYYLTSQINLVSEQHLQVTLIQSVFNTPMVVYQDHSNQPLMSHWE